MNISQKLNISQKGIDKSRNQIGIKIQNIKMSNDKIMPNKSNNKNIPNKNDNDKSRPYKMFI